MKVRNAVSIFLFAFVAFGFTQASAAQTIIQYYSVSAKQGQAVPKDCSDEGAIVQKLINLYDHPGSWHWIVVCDEPSWRLVETRMGQQSDQEHKILASTAIDERYTYIRGWAMTHPFSDVPEAQPDHTIRHELGHILNKSHDERVAEDYAKVMLQHRLAYEQMIAKREADAKAKIAAEHAQIASASESR